MNKALFEKLLGASIILNALYCLVFSLINSYQMLSLITGASDREISISQMATMLAMPYLLASVIFIVSFSLGWLLLRNKQIHLAVAITAGLANIFNGSIGFGLAVVYCIYRVATSSKEEQHNQRLKRTP